MISVLKQPEEGSYLAGEAGSKKTFEVVETRKELFR